MEGGVIRIRFEADTSGIDEQLKQIETTASSVAKANSSSVRQLNAQTRLATAQAQKLTAETKKQYALIAKKNPELLKEAVAIKKSIELSREKTKRHIADKQAEMVAEKRKIITESQAEKQLQYDQKVRYALQEKEERELLQQARQAAKIKLQEERKAAKEAAQIARDEKAKQREQEKAERDAEKTKRDEARAAEKAERDKYIKLKESLYLYYDIKNILELTKKTFENIAKAIGTVIKAQLQWHLALAKVVTPVTTLTAKFLKTSGILNKIKSAFSFNSILQFGKSSVEAASDLTEVQNIVETAFPNMTGQMNDWAKASINAFGLSEKSAKQYASTLGLMAQSAGLTEESSYKLGTSLTAVTADLASIYNMNASDVYEKIRSGVIGGRTAAIAQLGINMNQSNLQAYMESKGLSSKYTSLDNATKTIIRYNYVLEQTKKIQGDFVKTQGTWANQTRILAENMTALKAEFGSFIVTVLTPALQVLNGILQVLTKAIAKIKEILPLLGFKIQSASSSSSINLDGYADGLDDVGDAADEAASKVAKLSDGPFSEMHKVADNAASSLGNVFGGADGLLEYENPYKAQLESLGKVEKFLERISKKLDLGELKIAGFGVLKEIVGWIDAIKKAWKDAWNHDDKGTKYLQSFVDMVTSILNVVEDISNAFRTMYESEWGQIIFEKMLDLATDLNETVKQIFDRFDKFWNKGSGIYDWVDTKAGKTSDQKAAQDLAEKNGKKRDTTKGFISYSTSGDFRGSRQDMLDKVNQGKEFRELTWGEYIANQFYKAQVAILDCLDALLKFIQEVNNNIDWEEIFKSWGETLDNFAKALNNLSDWLKNNPQIAQKLGEIFTWILSNPDKIFFTIAALKAFKYSLIGIGSAVMLHKLRKAFWIKFFGLDDTLFGTLTKKATTGVNKIISGITSPFKNAFQMDGVLGGLLDSAILIAAVNELGSIVFKMVGTIWDKVKESGVKGLADIGFWLLEIPEKCRGPISTVISKIGTFVVQFLWDHIFKKVHEINSAFYGAIWDWLKEKFEGLKEAFGQFGEFLSGFWENLKSGPLKFLGTISSVMGKIVSEVGKAIGKLKEFLGLQSKVESKSEFTGTKGAAWVKTSGAQKAGYANIGNITKHAAGGVFTPNRPHLAVLGDHRSETEFALTESHLDEIANRMAGAISAQMMRMSAVQNTRSGGNNTYIIQIGDEQIQDFIVKTVDENNYRR